MLQGRKSVNVREEKGGNERWQKVGGRFNSSALREMAALAVSLTRRDERRA